MLKAMLFWDFENFDIAKNNYYKNIFSKAKTGVKQDEEAPQFSSIYNPRLDFNALPVKN